ncbi:MAG: ATP-grasp domain-containing protein [Gammaproteobacteria bacterium]|jgi:hypothetical protein
MENAAFNIFVVGLDDFNLSQMKTLPGASKYRFHELFSHSELKYQDHFPVRELLAEGVERLRSFPGEVDAVVGYWDFPVSTVLPLLRAAVGLPTTSLESVLKCEHKYWSRLLQRDVAAAHVPDFAAVNPFMEDPLEKVPLPYPFWIKPVKSVLSHLGYRVTDDESYLHALRNIRERIHRYAEPFNLILSRAGLPAQIASVDGYHCIAESIISQGRQCTLEGYCRRGEVVVYGVIDSLREGPGGSSFSRYQYPSTLPADVIERMTAVTRRVMLHIGYVNAPFNIEFFWDEASDALWLLEINTRISKSHAPLFKLVDGCYHHQVMLNLALDREPDFPYREGEFAVAAKFMLRHYEDALVSRVPSADELESLEAEYPGTRIQVEVAEGMRLSSLRDQDSYSFELAVFFIGAQSTAELEEKYSEILTSLTLELSPLPS